MFNNIAVCDTDVDPICLGAFRGAQVEAANNMQFGIGSKELRLDDNQIDFLPPNMGKLTKLKSLSLRNNQFTVTSTVFTERNPQPIPQSLFADTSLIDLNLHGNKMTNTELNQFEGFQAFLDRRQKVKSKTLVNLSLCGLP